MSKSTEYIDWYLDWLRSSIKLNKIDDYTEVTTPFLDRHNDHIQFYIKQDGDNFTLTDDGYTIGDLEASGCKINTEHREEILRVIINGFGVKLEKEELYIKANKHNFAQRQHLLIQAIISINDMFMLSQSRVTSVFLEDVEHFLNQNDIRYIPTVQIVGKSGFSHNIHFVIPLSKKQPERLIKAINNPTRDKAQATIFAWSDLKGTRKHDASLFVFMNDSDKPVRPEVVNAFGEYGIKSITWSGRRKYTKELAA